MPLEFLIDKLKALYSKQNTLPKLIEGEFIPVQTIEKYYVELKIMLDDKSGLNKETISERQIFERIKDKQEAHKVLIVGESGTGKSTLLQKMAYMWGKGEFFQDQFDYIIKIKLKFLKGWQKVRSDYSVDERDELLKCFIHYALRQERLLTNLGNEYSIKKEEIFRIIDQSEQNKILLLVDGYDEIESFILSQDDPEIKNIIDEIFKFKNIVMTSRPSVINSGVKRYFDRFIENHGLSTISGQNYIEQFFINQRDLLIQELDKYRNSETDKSLSLLDYLQSPDNMKYEFLVKLTQKIGIAEALLSDSNIEEIKEIISNYYISSKNSLIKVLESNQNLRELAAIPINVIILCLFYSDKKYIEQEKNDSESNKVFNLSGLYNEFIIWLGKRYQEKIEGRISTTSKSIPDIPVLQYLKEIAYKTFTSDLVIPEITAVYSSGNEPTSEAILHSVSNKEAQISIDSTKKSSERSATEVSGKLLDEVGILDTKPRNFRFFLDFIKPKLQAFFLGF